jgi:hypothetical protein
MNHEDVIIRLLTEIRDNQQLTIRRLSVGIAIGVVMIVGGIVAVALYFLRIYFLA